MIGASNALNSSSLIFPALEVCHIVGFALSVGTIALVDFRLLGFGMTHQTPAEVAADLAPWTMGGLAAMLISGPAMFSTDPDMYYLNRAFQLKMVFLLLGILFNYTVHRRVALSGGTRLKRAVTACVSLALWVGVIAGGLFIGFV